MGEVDDEIRHPELLRPVMDAARQARSLVMVEIDSGGGPQDRDDLLERLEFGFRVRPRGDVRRAAVGLVEHRRTRDGFRGQGAPAGPGEIAERLRDAVDGKDVVHRPRALRAARHPLERRKQRILGVGQAAVALDGLETGRPVPAGAGQDDPDGTRAQIDGQRLEELVDGGRVRVVTLPVPQVQAAIGDRQRPVRREHIDVIRLDRLPIDGILNRHRGSQGQQARQLTAVDGGEVGQQDERHPSVRR